MDNYEEKYKSALKWMQSLYGGLHGVTKEEAEKCFPELKESNSERIKFLIKSCVYASNITPEGREEIFAWLEKQGHMLNAAKVIEWIKHYNITDCDVRTSIIPDSSPTSNPHRVRWFSEDFIEQFKKDFEI